MSELSGNSCNIITILPMGLDCESVDATTPDSTNGSTTLYVTGGTPPYNISWNNGSQGNFLNNLKPGNYTATVVDYYGDYTATTTCTVGFTTFYLDEFKNCENNNKVYYLADLPSIFTSGKTYELTTQTGCWTYSGLTTYTNQTYLNTTAQISSGPYNTCQQCLPEPTPTPVYPEKLCLTLKDLNVAQQVGGNVFILNETYSSGNTINGYPSWSAQTPLTTIYYNSGSTRWEISGWTLNGLPVFNNPTIPPIGTWTYLGTSGYELNVSSGICQTPPLLIQTTRTNPTCTTTNNGSIFIFQYGGTSPYTYSLDGVNYQVANIFTSLAGGTYTVYVKDSSNVITSQSVILTPQATFQNYTINLTPLTQSTIVGSNSETRTSTFKIDVTPSLPNNKTVSFVMPVNIALTGNTTTLSPVFQTQQTSNLSFVTNGSATIITSPTSTPVTTTNPKDLPCQNINVLTSAYTVNYQGTITGNGSIVGTLTQQLTTPTISRDIYACPLSSNVKNVIGILNQNLTPTTCSYLNGNVLPLTYGFDKSGLNIDTLSVCFIYKSDVGGDVLCSHIIAGTYNNKPYFELKDSTCNTNIGLYVYWKTTQPQRWEVRDGLGSGTLFAYNTNPAQYPASDQTHTWTNVDPRLVMQSSNTGGCEFSDYETYLKYAEAVGLTQSASVQA